MCQWPKNQWSTGICDCFDDLFVCCTAYWCFPCFACKTASDFGECFCLPLLDALWTSTLLVGAPVCVPPVAMAMRVGVRNRYDIQGDMCSDCIYATFCNMCSWCQLAREIKRRNQPLTIINSQPTVIASPAAVIASQQPTVIASQPTIIAPQPAVFSHQPTVMTAQSTVMTTQLL
ncbi:hypothetical protein AGOR_G00073750 [Albula goreensis]|uniref:Uncharacterized protein n=1 Tax=Albula goreensis TaxID=1534307 RepID=A0A8T3DRY7_9TELE|nr:hypothetical protein AGOR_G00073750 [Albula goreensis]